MLLASTLEQISIPDAAVTALLGYGVVFAGLIALMLVVTALGKAFSPKKAESPKAVAAAPVANAAAPAVTTAAADVAPGTAGELKLHDVPPKTAAMLMAIVADSTGKPLNELRFKSIKEVK